MARPLQPRYASRTVFIPFLLYSPTRQSPRVDCFRGIGLLPRSLFSNVDDYLARSVPLYPTLREFLLPFFLHAGSRTFPLRLSLYVSFSLSPLLDGVSLHLSVALYSSPFPSFFLSLLT